MGSDRVGATRLLIFAAFAVVLAFQVFLGLWGAADQWTRGHNGWNGSAYHNAARNTLRWGVVFPLQYDTDNVPPKKEQLYTHAPLAMHLHNVASVRILGDRELSIRLVAALWSIGAVCMLFAVVRRLWSDAHGLVASALYVALPINAIYTNMANHSAGFIFWSLLALYLYIRGSRASPWRWTSFALFLGAFFMAATWDWPAYHIAFCIAVHWICMLTKQTTTNASSRPGTVPVLQLGLFCGWVLLLFAGHLGLVEWLTGNLDELTGTFNARRALSWKRFRTHLLVVPELMFTKPLLGLCAAWVGAWVVRLGRGTARARDLLPIAYLFGGFIHYLTFRWSAIVHSYWAWPMLPFVAIAATTSLFAAGRWLQDRARRWLSGKASDRSVSALAAAAGLSVVLLLMPLAVRDAQIVPQGRYVGGSMWFFTPVRGTMDRYDSGRPELRFAEQVKAWTDRATGVQLHTSFKPLRLEPRFDITLDRATYRWAPRPRAQMSNDQGVEGWVFVASVDAFSEDERASWAAHHPYRQLDDYFMLDLRTEARDIEVWGAEPLPYSVGWWLFHSAFEPPVRMERIASEEVSLRRKGRDAQ